MTFAAAPTTPSLPPPAGRALEIEYRPRHPLDLYRTVMIQRRGAARRGRSEHDD